MIFKIFSTMFKNAGIRKSDNFNHERSKSYFNTFSSSNTSGETPKHPKHHRSFSRKRGRTPSTDASRLRSVSACGAETSGNRRRSGENQPLILNRSLSVEAEEEEETVERMMAGPGIPKASSLVINFL
jgi:hypothetical protein